MNLPVLGARVVAYEGEGCSEETLRLSCPTRDKDGTSPMGGIVGDGTQGSVDGACAGKNCKMRAVLRGEVRWEQDEGGRYRTLFDPPSIRHENSRCVSYYHEYSFVTFHLKGIDPMCCS